MALKDRSRDSLVAEALKKGIEGAQFLTKAELLLVLGAEHPKPFFKRARSWLAKALARFDGEPTVIADDFASHVDTPSLETPLTAPPAVDDKPVTSEEPIVTQTMARLLAEQGHADRARAIEHELAKAGPPSESPPESHAEVEGESRAATAVSSTAAEPETLLATSPIAAEPETLLATSPIDTGREDVEVPVDALRDHLTAQPISSTSMLVVWSVSPRARLRAEHVLTGAGELTLRVASWYADGDGHPRSELVTRPCESSEGQHVLSGLPPASACVVAIGLVHGDRFVAINHVRRFSLPTEAPVLVVATPLVASFAAPRSSAAVRTSPSLALSAQSVLRPRESGTAPRPSVQPDVQLVETRRESTFQGAFPQSPRTPALAALKDSPEAVVASSRLSVDPRAPEQSLSFVRYGLGDHGRSSDLAATR